MLETKVQEIYQSNMAGMSTQEACIRLLVLMDSVSSIDEILGAIPDDSALKSDVKKFILRIHQFGGRLPVFSFSVDQKSMKSLSELQVQNKDRIRDRVIPSISKWAVEQTV